MIRTRSLPGEAYRWEFKPRFRRHALGWKSQLAIKRVKQAVGEIKKVARTDPMLAADSAVSVFERLSPALEHVGGPPTPSARPSTTPSSVGWPT